ncbi:MAG: permease [Lagierella massiliensis]|nr:permease [Lagierella massiliensis]
MDIFTLGIWVMTLIFLGISLTKDKNKTVMALKKAFRMGRGMVISIFSIIFAIGLILTIIPPEDIATFIRNNSVFLATVGGAILGTVALVPPFVAFPLVGTLVEAGVDIMPSVAFLTTLTMVGVVTLPLEKKTFGAKFTFIRNGLSFIFAIIIAIVMGGII